MKKNFLKPILLTGMILSLGGLVSSCSDDETNGGPTPGTDDKNTYVTTEGPTPIRYVESKYIGSKNGVSVEVTSSTTNGLKFVCQPGEDVVSYRVQVYPQGSMYNTMLNTMNAGKLDKLTTTDTEDILLMALNNTEATTGGKLMNAKSYGDDFASYEFDYMNSDLKIFDIQPNLEYLIVVQGYFDEEGIGTPGDICIVHVKTPKKELVGNPQIAFNVEPEFTKYSVLHIPNGDCKYFYYLGGPTSGIDQYIEAYGEDMYRQLLCHYGDRVDVSTDELAYVSDDGLDPSQLYVTTAVAMDANGTSANKIFRKEIELRKIPDVTEAAQCTISVPDKIGGSIIEFPVRLEKNCPIVRFLVVTKSEGETVMNGSEEVKKDYAARLHATGSLTDGGWAVQNLNFSFDRDNNKPTGNAFDTREFWWELRGDTEYMILYAGANYYNEIADLQATGVFKTKPLVRDNPTAATEDIKMDIIATSRTSVTLQFTYDTEKTSLYYFQYYSPNVMEAPYTIFPDIQDGSNDARYGTGKYAEKEYLNDHKKSGWLHYFLDYRDPTYGLPWPNMWRAEGSGNQVEKFEWDGFEPGNTYEFAYMGEDWDGILGPVKFCSGTTQSVTGGNNPTITATFKKSESGSYMVTYTANADTRQILYAAATLNSTEAKSLALQQLLDKDDELSYKDYIETWEDHTLSNGLSTPNLTQTQEVVIDSDIAVAMAMAVGGENAGEPVYSKLSTLIFVNGQVMSLEEYLGVKTVTVTVPRNSFGPAHAVQPGSRTRMARNR